MDDGMTAEIASVGREGMLGLGSFLNAMATEPEAMAAVPGLALPVEVEQVQAVLADVPEFALVLLRYAAVHLAMVGHTSACGRLHDTRSRLARWLLLMDDRQVAQTTSLTHETLAEVLGVRRPSVTIAASQLQRAGCLRYTRGHMEILDRAQLIRWSCECYVPMRESLASMVAHYAA
jgi:CRP-like cAMP-binding protein